MTRDAEMADNPSKNKYYEHPIKITFFDPCDADHLKLKTDAALVFTHELKKKTNSAF